MERAVPATSLPVILRPLTRSRPVRFAALLLGGAMFSRAQTPAPVPVYAFSHLAGSLGGYGNADGIGPAARFTNPTGLAVDSVGNIFVADSWTGSVRKVNTAGVVTTLLTTDSLKAAGLPATYGRTSFAAIVADAQDNLFITDVVNSLIFKLTLAGNLSLYTGQTGPPLYTSTDGTLAQASFNDPAGIARDATGNLYIADGANHIIRKISPDGIVSTFAGTPPEYGNPRGSGVSQRLVHSGSADGTGTSAQFFFPTAVAVDANGNVYVADQQNHTIRKITPSGVVTTLAGTALQEGSTDGTGSAARFRYPSGIATDATGNLYVTDSGNGTVRKVTPSGVVTTLAGAAGEFASVDGTGNAARFVSPKGITLDRSGRLLVGDGFSLYVPHLQSGAIRRVTLEGVVTTVAGRGGALGSIDAKGEAARFRDPADVAVDAAGNVFVSDELNHTIRKVSPDGTVTTFAGTPGQVGHADGPGSGSSFNHPTGLAFDLAGRLLVADQDNHLIRRIAPDGFVSTVAGVAGVAGTDDGSAGRAKFHSPISVAVDGSGNILVGDGDYFPGSGDPARQFSTIRKISPNGTVTTLAGNPQIVDYDFTRYDVDGVGPNARFGDATGLAAAGDGTLFVADLTEGKIRKVTPDGTTTTLTLVDSAGASVVIRSPYGLTRDKAGNLYVSDFAIGTLYFISLAGSASQTTGVVTRLAGTPGVVGSADGVGTSVQFNQPSGMKIDDKGNLYVADTENHAIRRGVLAGAPVITAQPQSASIAAGGSVQFSVTATGIPTPTYQWYVNGMIFQGATGTALNITNVRAADAGDYTVIVTNDVGNITSSKATLTVTAGAMPPPPSQGGGGGGGAPSIWFVSVLSLLGTVRYFSNRKSADERI